MHNENIWRVVPYSPDLAGDVASFSQRIWPEADIADERYHRWQYQANPAGQALAAIAQDRISGALTGQFAAIPLRVSIDGEPQLAALALNVATDPELRRTGVFSALGSASKDLARAAGSALLYAMPNENSFPGFISRLGYGHAGDIPFLVRPVNLGRLARARLRIPVLPRFIAAAARPFAPPLPTSPEPVVSVEVSNVKHFTGDFDEFWRRLRNRHRIMVIRDATFLEWRYVQVPLREYVCYAASVAGELAGYIILRLATMLDLKTGFIVDFVTEASERGRRAGLALMSRALAHFAGQDVDLLAALMLRHAAEYPMLRGARFRPLPSALLPQPFRLVAEGPKPALSTANWFFTFGDYDVV